MQGKIFNRNVWTPSNQSQPKYVVWCKNNGDTLKDLFPRARQAVAALQPGHFQVSKVVKAGHLHQYQ